MKNRLLTVTAAIGLSVFILSTASYVAATDDFESKYRQWKENISGEFYIPKEEIDNTVDQFICYDEKDGSFYGKQTIRVANVRSKPTVTLYYNESDFHQLKTTELHKDKMYYIYDLGDLHSDTFDTSAAYEKWKTGGSLYDFVKLNSRRKELASIVRLQDPADMRFSYQQFPDHSEKNTGWYAAVRSFPIENREADLANSLDIYFDPGNQTMDEILLGDKLKLELEKSKLDLSKTKCIAVETSGWSFWTVLLLFSDGKNEYLFSPGGYVYFQNFLEAAYYKPEERRQFAFEANKLYDFHEEVLPFLLEETAIAKKVAERIPKIQKSHSVK